MALKVILHESEEDRQWRVRFTSDNNEPWFTSEGYGTGVGGRSKASRSANDFIDAVVSSAVNGEIHYETRRLSRKPPTKK